MSLHRRATEHTSRFAGRDALTANEHEAASELGQRWKLLRVELGRGPAPSDSRRALAGRGRRAFDRTSAVTGKDVAATSQAAVDVAQSALDLELLYRGNVEPDRFHLHTQQLRVHAAAKNLAGVAGEVAVLEWIRDRLAASVRDSDMSPDRFPKDDGGNGHDPARGNVDPSPPTAPG